MFNKTAYENSRPDGVSVLEVVPDSSEAGVAMRLFVPLKRTHLTGEVVGPLADLRLTQTYGYSREQCDKTLEALYRFPLPGDAAVTGVRVRFGEVTIEAELKERKAAEASYEEAKQEGRQAALATRESPDVFTLQVAGIQPDQEIMIETAYVQLARMEGAQWTLRIPLTTAPRYVRSDEASSRHAAGQPLALLRDPGHRFSLDVTLREASAATSATHALDVTGEHGIQRVQLKEGEVLPDRDCVLAWKPWQDEKNPSLRVLLHDDQASGQVYFLALVAPPASRGVSQTVPREVTLLVDHSGSMEGPKWAASDWAVKRFLGDLTEQDTFALGLFHSETHWFGKTPRKADANGVAEAIRYLESRKDSGGTNLGVALEQALNLSRTPGERSRHLLIVTDAEVSDSGRILRLAEEETKRKDRERISVLCIDAAPNSFLAMELAERGGGVAKFLTSEPEEEDISTALDSILEDWTAPVLSNLRLEVSRPNAQSVGRETLPAKETGWSALDMGDLPQGRAVWVAGRAPRGEGRELEFRVTNAEGRVAVSTVVPIEANSASHPALKALFGARRLVGLEFLIHSGRTDDDLKAELNRLGYDAKKVLAGKPDAASKVYAENTREDVTALLRDFLVRESLDYGLACSETAFFAERSEAGQKVESTAIVANALPAGWSNAFASGAPPVLLSAPMSGFASPPPSPARMQADYDMLIAQYGARGDAAKDSDAAVGQAPSALNAMASGITRLFKRAAPAPPAQTPVVPEPKPQTKSALFSGAPPFVQGEAILFDSMRDGDTVLPQVVMLSRLEIAFPNGAPDAAQLDPGLALLLYVDDLASPRARVRLVDLIRQGGARPLNIRRLPGQMVRITLADPAGVWAQNPPMLEIRLS